MLIPDLCCNHQHDATNHDPHRKQLPNKTEPVAEGDVSHGDHCKRDSGVRQYLLKGSKYELPLTVDLFTGMREGELLGLMWDCVNFEKGTILIDKQLRKGQEKGGKYYFSPPKNNKSRTLTPAPYVMKLLRAQKVHQTEQKLMAGPAWEDTGLVFTNEFGRYISYRALYDSFKRTVNQIEIPSARIHDLRHTYAVNCIRAGDDIKTVQGNLGHATAAFTLDVYGHFTDDMRTASSPRTEGFITKVLNL